MSTPHLLNIALHVLAGTIAMVIGCYQLGNAKGGDAHRRWGWRFCYAGFVVCASAAAGLMAFRFLPNFAVLTVAIVQAASAACGPRSRVRAERQPPTN